MSFSTEQQRWKIFQQQQLISGNHDIISEQINCPIIQAKTDHQFDHHLNSPQQFHQRILKEFYIDFQSAKQGLIPQSSQAENKGLTAQQIIQEEINNNTNQFAQRLNQRLRTYVYESSEQKLLEETFENIQKNEEKFVKKYFATHEVMSKKLIEESRYMLLNQAHFVSLKQKINNIMNEDAQEKIFTLSQFYKIVNQQFDEYFPDTREISSKKIIPKRIQKEKLSVIRGELMKKLLKKTKRKQIIEE